jgi:SAM-dependent methyltransferase
MRSHESYHGEKARSYDAGRVRTRLWRDEQAAFQSMLGRCNLDEGARVLDVQVGTGRFLGIYEHAGLDAMCVDLSNDMLDQARDRSTGRSEFRLGDATQLEFASSSMDLVVCVRLLYLLPAAEMKQVIAELGRVSKRSVILTVRVAGWDRSTRLRERVARRIGTARAVIAFVRGRLNVRPHSRGTLLSAFRRAGLEPKESLHLTRMSDDSDYLMLRLDRRK